MPARPSPRYYDLRPAQRVHDNFCRCRACKPSLAQATQASVWTRRLEIIVAISGAIVGFLVVTGRI